LYSQFEVRHEIQSKRRAIWERYHEGLAVWASTNDVKLPFIPEHCEQTFHIFYLVLPSLAIRQQMIDWLKQHRILSVFHYVPLHLSAMGRRFGGRPGQCPVTEYVSDRLLRLPLYFALSEADQARVVDAVCRFDAVDYPCHAAVVAAS